MIKPVFTLGTSLEAKEIRQEVFVQEQGFQNEFDEYEKTATTLVLFLDDIPIATGRLRTLDPETYKIERVAVRKHRNLRCEISLHQNKNPGWKGGGPPCQGRCHPVLSTSRLYRPRRRGDSL